MATLREEISRVWSKLRGRPIDYGLVDEDELWRHRRRRGGPPPEDALVPTGPPRTPPRSSAEALPLPEPEDWDVDAIGLSSADD